MMDERTQFGFVSVTPEEKTRRVRGVFVGDSSGLGCAVVWVADGVINVVAGSLAEKELLGVADSLR